MTDFALLEFARREGKLPQVNVKEADIRRAVVKLVLGEEVRKNVAQAMQKERERDDAHSKGR